MRGLSHFRFFSTNLKQGVHPIAVGKTVGSLCFALNYLSETGTAVEIINASTPTYGENECVMLSMPAMKVFRKLGIEKEIVKNGALIQKVLFLFLVYFG
jgi:hypothetical protein